MEYLTKRDISQNKIRLVTIMNSSLFDEIHVQHNYYGYYQILNNSILVTCLQYINMKQH